MIPKIIHYCWFGGQPVPEEYRKYMDEWQTLNPDWTIIGWDEQNVNTKSSYLARAIETSNWANVSNFVRLHTLLHYGGVYLDTDVKLLKPLDVLAQNECFFGFEEGDETSDVFYVNNAVCGAERDHFFIKLCYEYLLETFSGDEQSNLSSPRLTTDLLIRECGLSTYGMQTCRGIRIYPKEYFYPIHYNEIYKLAEIEKHITADTYAVHVWSRSWLSKDILLHIMDGLHFEFNKITMKEDEPVPEKNILSQKSGEQIFSHSVMHYTFDFFISQMKKYEAEINQQKNENGLLLEKIDRLNSEAKHAITEQHAKEIDILNKQWHISQLTKNREAAESLRITLQEKADYREKRILQLEKSVELGASELAITRQHAAVLTERLEGERSLSEQQKTDAEQLLVQRQLISAQLKAENDELSYRLDELRDRNSFLQTLGTDKDHQINELKQQLESIINELNDSITRKDIESNQLAAGIKKMDQQLKQSVADIDWYRRTFEQRRLRGILKDRLFKKMENASLLKSMVKGYYKISKAKINHRFPKRILCSIVNHNCNQNTERLRKVLNRHFDTVVLDSGSKVRPPHALALGNVYYSGLLNTAFEFAVAKNYDFLFFICSDVEFEEAEVVKMVRSLSQYDLDDIGVYSPSSSGRSHSFCKKQAANGLHAVPFTEGFIFVCSLEVLKCFLPMSLGINKYGWGLDVAKGYFSRKLGKICVIDDDVSVFHPESTGYSNKNAEEDMLHMVDYIADSGFKNFFNKIISAIRNGAIDKNTVSVIIPAYNQSAYIEGAVKSCLLQEYANIEIILINDGSTDDTEAICMRIAQQFNQVRFFSKPNGGLGNTRNFGVSKSRGEFIQFLDADDHLSSNKIFNQVHTFISDRNIDVSYSGYLCYEDGNDRNTWTYSRVQLNGDPLLDLIQNWEKELSIPIHCFLYRRSAIGGVNFDESLPNHEDWLFHLITATQCKSYGFEPEGLAFYRVRNNSMARDREMMTRGRKMCIQNAIASDLFEEKYVKALQNRLID